MPMSAPAVASIKRAPTIITISTGIGSSNTTDRPHSRTERPATQAAGAPNAFVFMPTLYKPRQLLDIPKLLGGFSAGSARSDSCRTALR
ncbi:hypothetical protein SAMN04489718_0838 [Actinopolyspora saharensis]|uniref:Uncharacterized protein n=1 Tax=Actinopolyspora saharensis TaxID=995062 RepID=A0A1H0Z579_9ACTN|nr:hypothetical protein SAMN04489718_0838 [Actinopolyspora saharensis]